jgi:hypothetical protein
MQDGTRVAVIVVASGAAVAWWRLARGLAGLHPFPCLLGFVAVMLVLACVAAAGAVDPDRPKAVRGWWTVAAAGLLLVTVAAAVQLPSAFLFDALAESDPVPPSRR